MPVPRRFIVRTALIAIALTLATGSNAAAGDLCIDAGGGFPQTFQNPLLILRGFTLPGKNKCKQAQGVVFGYETALSGSACTSYDGGHVTFSLVASTVYEKTSPTDLSGFSMIYGVRLNPSTLTGGVTYSNLNGTTIIGTAVAYECKKAFPGNY